MQGERFNEFKKDNFYQIQWRPRPASLLTSVQKKKVVKNLRKVRVRLYYPCAKKIDRHRLGALEGSLAACLCLDVMMSSGVL